VLTILEILDAVGKARKERRECKKRAESLSIECRHRLAAAKEEAGQGKAATILRGMYGVEAQRTQAKNVIIHAWQDKRRIFEPSHCHKSRWIALRSDGATRRGSRYDNGERTEVPPNRRWIATVG